MYLVDVIFIIFSPYTNRIAIYWIIRFAKKCNHKYIFGVALFDTYIIIGTIKYKKFSFNKRIYYLFILLFIYSAAYTGFKNKIIT